MTEDDKARKLQEAFTSIQAAETLLFTARSALGGAAMRLDELHDALDILLPALKLSEAEKNRHLQLPADRARQIRNALEKFHQLKDGIELHEKELFRLFGNAGSKPTQ